MNEWNKVVLCDSYDATTHTPSGNVVEVPYDGAKPETIEEAEALCEAKLSGAELTKARSLITNFKAKRDEGEAK